jgi:NADH dehydrogenase
MKNVLVLGGSGFVGAHVCEKLVRAGASVTVPTRRRNNARKLMHLPTLTVLELDVHDEAALRQVMAGHDAVVNCVAILHGTAAQFERTHVDLARSLARACVANQVQQLVHISALGVSPAAPQTAPSQYLRSKSLGEHAIAQAHGQAHEPAHEQAQLRDRAMAQTKAQADVRGPGVQVSILRPSVIFGAEDKFLNLFASLQKLAPFVPLAGAHARFAPVWVEDVAQAVLECLQRRGRSSGPLVLELCGPEVFNLQQLVQLAGGWSGVGGGRGRAVLPLPHWAGYLQALLMECAPGVPLMSRDNLDSMKVDNVATGAVPGLELLGITPASMRAIAPAYLGRGAA